MSESARIHDVEVLKAARGAIADFAEQVGTALASVDADIERVGVWLNVERATHWKLEARRRNDEVERGKSEIMRKRLIAAPEPASVVFEERQLDKAKRRLEHAQAKLEKVRRWAPVWEREALLYKSSTRALTEALHADIPRAMAILSAMMESLEAYSAMAPPAGEPEAGIVEGDRGMANPAPESPESSAREPREANDEGDGVEEASP